MKACLRRCSCNLCSASAVRAARTVVSDRGSDTGLSGGVAGQLASTWPGAARTRLRLEFDGSILQLQCALGITLATIVFAGGLPFKQLLGLCRSAGRAVSAEYRSPRGAGGRGAVGQAGVLSVVRNNSTVPTKRGFGTAEQLQRIGMCFVLRAIGSRTECKPLVAGRHLGLQPSLPALGLGIVPGSMLGAACTQGRGEPR